jgi:anaerobic selenocysteine-containing dehydrogenase
MGASGFDYESVDEIQKEISALVPDFKIDGEYYRKPHQFKEIGAVVSPKHKENKANTKSDHFPFLLSVSVVEHTHRGFPLAFWVEGSKMLLTEGMLEIHPEDAAAIGISNGDNVEITSSTINRIFPVKLHKEQPRGTLHISLRECSYIQPNPQSVNIRKVNV